MICSYVRTQHVIAKSSGETEFYGLVDCAQEEMLLAAVLKFLRHEVIIECGTDSSAAKTMAERLGVGPRVRHLEVDSLWIQQAVREKHVRLKKVKGKVYEPDLGTKALDVKRFRELLTMANCVNIKVDKDKVQAEIVTRTPRKWEDEPGVGAVGTHGGDMKDMLSIVRDLVVAIWEN